MSKLLFIFAVLLGTVPALAWTIPPTPSSFVLDDAGIFSITEKQSLENKISNFQKETGNEIAIVSIKSLDGDTIENVAQNIGEKWGVGSKEHNNGIVFLLAMEEHKIRIHVGYGLEGALPDITASQIIRNTIAPAFKGGHYFEGVNTGLDQIISATKGEYVNTNPDSHNNDNRQIAFWIWLIGFIIFIIIGIIRRKKSNRFFPWIFWGGFGGGSNNSSGFGGFGGGSFGGGGSSGDW